MINKSHIEEQADREKINSQHWQAKYYDSLYNYALCKLSNKHLAEDLVQETFLNALENVDRFEYRSSELTWLTAILKFKIYKVYRSKVKNKIVYSNDLIILDKPNLMSENRSLYPLIVLSPDFYTDLKTFETALLSHIRSLPSNWQRLYELQYELGKTTSEITGILKITNNNYWVLSHRLKSSLFKWFQDNWL
jgi:RNA polymerase sigma factor (sigma-70 family)